MNRLPSSDHLRVPFVESSDGSPRRACPDPERIWQSLAGTLSRRQVRAILRHATTCGPCSETWRLAHALGAMEAAEPLAARPATRLGRVAPWAAAAAAAVALLAIGPRLLELRAPEPGFRQPEPPGIRPLVASGEVLPRDAFVLRWEGPEAARYRVRVATADLTILLETDETDETMLRVPPALLAGLADGSLVVWRVEGRRPNGERIAPRVFTARLGGSGWRAP